MQETNLQCRYAYWLFICLFFFKYRFLIFSLVFDPFVSAGVHDSSYWSLLVQRGHEDGCGSIS